ncbi:Cas10/Cmr2 second palm domain-containing protein [Micromonospora sp. RTGN7]|uniref:Cas10/Cmr2 second palm domain-containing protein n=1 Tax=Micromonospora sp. RTGN7 TaxID=3016526 RepID=UPI0029FF02CE|nr:hypothetical protein [Micromonospora sp. RTGN7]
MDNEATGRKHWVLIETGGNQRYIFGSNRLRHVVGASQLVHEVGTEWVPEAVADVGLPEATVVTKASGKALLLVDAADDGRAIIRKVSERALREVPGLQVTGVVGPSFDASDDAAHEPARRATYKLHAAVRAGRPDPLVRDRVFPWHELCRDSGRPAAGMEGYGDEEPVPASAGVLARSQARDRARKRLLDKLAEGPVSAGHGRLSQVVPAQLEELRHDRWMAVVHADGNGVGGLFREFIDHIAEVEGGGPVSLATHAHYQRKVSEELETATWEAVRDAVGKLLDESSEQDAGWLLPIVVGGDDVTVACDAAVAVRFVRHFAEAYAVRTQQQETLSKVAAQATGHPGLAASAGIAVVKLHHPFATAYKLAEALTDSAKQLRHKGQSLAAFDVHVAHTSTLRELPELREYVEPAGVSQRVARHAGPYLIGQAEKLPVGLRHRSVELLDEIGGWLGPQGWLSAAQAHALREAADRSLAEYQYQLKLTVDHAPEAERARAHALLDMQPAPNGGDEGRVSQADDTDPGGPFLRLFDALHLRGLRLDSSAPSTTSSGSTSAGGAS